MRGSPPLEGAIDGLPFRTLGEGTKPIETSMKETSSKADEKNIGPPWRTSQLVAAPRKTWRNPHIVIGRSR